MLLIGWSLSQWPFFRRQNQQGGPLTSFLAGCILMTTLRYAPPAHSQCASFANSRAGISCCLSSAGNGLTMIHVQLPICHPHHPPTGGHSHLFYMLRQRWSPCLSRKRTKVAGPRGALEPASLAACPPEHNVLWESSLDRTSSRRGHGHVDSS